MEQPRFYLFILASLGLHGAALLLFLNSGNLKNFFKKEKNISVPFSVRVDMVALPDLPDKKPRSKAFSQEKKEKPVLIPKKRPPPKKPPKKKPKVPPAKKKEPKKAPQKEKSQEEEDIIKKPGPQSPSPSEEKKINKGNRLAEGAEEGKEILGERALSEINIYLTAVIGQIRSYWNLPKYLTDLNLEVQIEIRISEKGGIIGARISASSGNELFDSFALKAVESAAPYPLPPPGIRAFIRDGIVPTLSSKN